jgi:hypothetical protein
MYAAAARKEVKEKAKMRRRSADCDLMETKTSWDVSTQSSKDLIAKA